MKRRVGFVFPNWILLYCFSSEPHTVHDTTTLETGPHITAGRSLSPAHWTIILIFCFVLRFVGPIVQLDNNNFYFYFLKIWNWFFNHLKKNGCVWYPKMKSLFYFFISMFIFLCYLNTIYNINWERAYHKLTSHLRPKTLFHRESFE